MSPPSVGFKAIRRQLDDLGYYQSLVPEAVPLVEALLHDLLATTHNLKVAREEQKQGYKNKSDEEDRPLPPVTVTSASNVTSSSTDRTKISVLETKVRDLEILNAECLSIISGLQKDVEERSKKILKLELAGNRAKVVTHSDRPTIIDTSGPKIEMTSLIAKDRSSSPARPMTSSSSTSSRTTDEDLSVIKLYAKKNEQLEFEMNRLSADLEKAKSLLAHVDQHWNAGFSQKLVDEKSANTSEQSVYVLKLVQENSSLKSRLSDLEQHTRVCFHGKRVIEPALNCCDRKCKSCCGCSGGVDDIRRSVEKSHIELHNLCLKNQLKNKGASSTGNLDTAMRTHRHLEHQHNQLHLLQEDLRKNQEDNRTLTHRIAELNKVNETLRDKVRHLSEQQKILLASGNGTKVGELVHYVEHQRNIYRKNVEELLDKLDPDRRKVADTVEIKKVSEDKENIQEKIIGATQKPKIILGSKKSVRSGIDADDHGVKVVRRADEAAPQKKVELNLGKHYSPSAYKSSTASSSGSDVPQMLPDGLSSSASLQERCRYLEQELERLQRDLQKISSEKLQLEKKFLSENVQLKSELSQLKDNIGRLELESRSKQQKAKDQVLEIRNETDSNWSQYQEDIRAFQREIENLRAELQTKEGHLHQLSRDRDDLHRQLDDRAIEVDELRRQLRDVSSRAEQADHVKSSQDKAVNQCLLEIQHLKSKLSQTETESSSLRDRVEIEKSLNRELLTKNSDLKSELQLAADERQKSLEEMEDLRAHIQRYVNEVKRTEELLALRERERMELLNQYKHLSDDLDSAGVYGRKLESQVAQLKLDLSTRSAELHASELLLQNMEKDLVEISLSNENYRSQVATLSSRVDMAESELRSVRSQSSWVNADLSDVQQLVDQLTQQKSELHRQLSEQAREIETQNEEIQTLRLEITQLAQAIESEREKSATLERRVSRGSDDNRELR